MVFNRDNKKLTDEFNKFTQVYNYGQTDTFQELNLNEQKCWEQFNQSIQYNTETSSTLTFEKCFLVVLPKIYDFEQRLKYDFESVVDSIIDLVLVQNKKIDSDMKDDIIRIVEFVFKNAPKRTSFKMSETRLLGMYEVLRRLGDPKNLYFFLGKTKTNLTVEKCFELAKFVVEFNNSDLNQVIEWCFQPFGDFLIFSCWFITVI